MNNFWNKDVSLGEMEIRGRKKEIRLKARISREEFYNTRSEILDCLNNSKYRTHVFGKIYYREPVYMLHIAFNPYGLKIGRVERVERKGKRDVEIGIARAFYYDDVDILVLWECYLHKNICKSPKDKNFKTAWRGFEKFIANLFPSKVIYTPSWEPLYNEKEWIDFLESEGYSKYNELVFFKKI